jgi:hypothetical protein
MIVESTNNETVIRVPNTVPFNFIQDFIDYLSTKSIISKSEADDDEINRLAEQAQSDWWEKNKSKFLK